MSGRLLVALGAQPLTQELTVRYLKPVPVEVDLVLRVWLQGTQRGHRRVRSEVAREATGELLATGDALLAVPTERIEVGRARTGAWPWEPESYAGLMDDWEL